MKWRKKTAANKIKNYGNSFWTPLEPHAKELAKYVSDGFVGPEIHEDTITGELAGRYNHYHLSNRVKYKNKYIHIWYGYPEGGIF